jgi:hypothetical protein
MGGAMITSQFNNEIVPKTAVVSPEGEYLGAHCERVLDGALRFYGMDSMKADGGLGEIIEALDECPKREFDRCSA